MDAFPRVRKLRFSWEGFSCFIDLGHFTTKSPFRQMEQSTFKSGKAPINGFSFIGTNPLTDTLKFLCSLLFSLINFWVACGSIDFPYSVTSLSNGFEDNDDLNKLFGFSSGFLVGVFILEHIHFVEEYLIHYEYIYCSIISVSGGSTGDICGFIEEFLVIFDFIDKTKQDKEIYFYKSAKRLFLRSFLSYSFSWFAAVVEKSKYFFLIICQFSWFRFRLYVDRFFKN